MVKSRKRKTAGNDRTVCSILPTTQREKNSISMLYLIIHDSNSHKLHIPDFKCKHWIKGICNRMERLDARNNRHLDGNNQCLWITCYKKAKRIKIIRLPRKELISRRCCQNLDLSPEYTFNFNKHSFPVIPITYTLEKEKQSVTYCPSRTRTNPVKASPRNTYW